MIAWINLAVLLIASQVFLYFYHLSVSPAALEKLSGQGAYRRCGIYRSVAMFFELVVTVCYVLYYFYPLPTPLPEKFPWSYGISLAIAVLIAVPALGIMLWGMRDTGLETAFPKKEHTLNAGIYRKMRHPQAVGEVFLFWVMAFLLHSPFLALFSFLYFPIFLMMCWAEEHDLVLRFGDSYVEYYRRTGAFWPRRESPPDD